MPGPPRTPKWEHVALSRVEIGDVVREHDTAKPWRVQSVTNRAFGGALTIILHATDHRHTDRPDASIQRRPR